MMRLRKAAAGLTAIAAVMSGSAVATASPAAAEAPHTPVAQAQAAGDVQVLRRIESKWPHVTPAQKSKARYECVKVGAGGVKGGRWDNYDCYAYKTVYLLEVWDDPKGVSRR